MKIRKVKVIRIPCRKRKSAVSENSEFILRWFEHVVNASNEGRDVLDDIALSEELRMEEEKEIEAYLIAKKEAHKMVEAWKNSAKKEVN